MVREALIGTFSENITLHFLAEEGLIMCAELRNDPLYFMFKTYFMKIYVESIRKLKVMHQQQKEYLKTERIGSWLRDKTGCSPGN